tara:strand:- start:2001 stop:2237 length:237 start_codon:yes stop_codon:yes gene_type:complete
MKYKPGDLISRYSKIDSAKGHCVVVDLDDDNYTLYNNSLKCLKMVSRTVVERLYMRIVEEEKTNPDVYPDDKDVYEMT